MSKGFETHDLCERFTFLFSAKKSESPAVPVLMECLAYYADNLFDKSLENPTKIDSALDTNDKAKPDEQTEEMEKTTMDLSMTSTVKALNDGQGDGPQNPHDSQATTMGDDASNKDSDEPEDLLKPPEGSQEFNIKVPGATELPSQETLLQIEEDVQGAKVDVSDTQNRTADMDTLVLLAPKEDSGTMSKSFRHHFLVSQDSEQTTLGESILNLEEHVRFGDLR